MVDEVIRRGLVEPLFRTWDRSTGQLVAEFDFGLLKDETRYPFAVQCEQHKLANMAIERLRAFPHAKVEFSTRVLRLNNPAIGSRSVESGRGRRKVDGSYLIGADGGRSTVRKALDIEFEGYTHPERFLILPQPSTSGPGIPAARAITSRIPRTGARCSR